VGVYASGRSRPAQALAKFVVWEPAHWVMQKRQFTNLKRRAERNMVDLTAGGRPVRATVTRPVP
jgi:hypothetical protein